MKIDHKELNTGNSSRMLYSLKDAAYQLSISKRGVSYLIAAKKLTTVKLGGRTMISAEALRVLITAGMCDTFIVPQKKGR